SGAAATSLDDSVFSQRVVDLGLVQSAALNLGDAFPFARHQRFNCREHFFGVGARHDGNAVFVADDDVARHDNDVAAGDRNVDLTGAVFVATARAHASAERRKSELRYAADVANGAIDDDAAELLRGRRGAHQFAEDGRAVAPARRDNDDLA